MQILDREWFGNPVWSWAFALLLGLLVALLLRLGARFLVRRLAALSEQTATFWDDVVAGMLAATKTWFLALVALLVATLVLALPADWEFAVRRATAVGLILQGGLWLAAGLDGWLSDYRRRRIKEDAAAVTTVAALAFLGRIVLWSIVLLLVLDNFGIDVTALVAGLGIGGIAVALAAQNILGDLFASMSIVLDKPFVLGDFVVVGEEKGTVEHIGLKSTRVRSLTGEQIVFSNSDLLSSRLRNFGRLRERRITFGVGTTYQTSREQLERIPQILRQAVEAADRVRFDRAHFKSLGAFALEFEVVYYVTVPDYAQYMDIQQGINLRIFGLFEEAGIQFAYPTQTLILENTART